MCTFHSVVVNIQNHPAFVWKLVLKQNLGQDDFDSLPPFPPLPLLNAQYDSFVMARTTKKEGIPGNAMKSWDMG